MPRTDSESGTPSEKSPMMQITKGAGPDGKASSGHSMKLGTLARKFAFARFSAVVASWASSRIGFVRRENVNPKHTSATSNDTEVRDISLVFVRRQNKQIPPHKGGTRVSTSKCVNQAR